MTTGGRHGATTTCPRCGTPHRHDDDYCGSCRARLSDPAPAAPAPAPPAPSPAPSDAGDDTTRYLCAAAQLDRDFADRAIAEYLVEDVRSVPPSPGVDAVAVLREAVAARARRRLRDAVLLVALALLLVTNPLIVVLWLVIAVVATIGMNGLNRTPGDRRRATAVAVAGVLALLLVVVLPRLLLGLFGLPAAAGGLTVSGLLLVLTVVIVLAVDAGAVHVLVHEKFRRGRFRPDAATLAPGWERTLLGLGGTTYDRALARVAAGQYPPADDSADVLVHRGAHPFVGAGVELRPEVFALPLEPADADGPAPRPVDVLDLHEHMASCLGALRSSTALTPGGRLGTLTDRARVLIPAERLVVNIGCCPESWTSWTCRPPAP